MRVHHEARGGTITERIAVELEPREAEALADFYASLFDDGKSDPIATGLRKIAREWRLDSEPQGVLTASVSDGGSITATAPISSGGRPR